MKEEKQIRNVTTPQPVDFLAGILETGVYLKLQKILLAVNERIPRLEDLMGRKINDHLGWFGDQEGYDKRIVKYSDKKAEHTFAEGCSYIGEWDYSGLKPNGRGIQILSYDIIYMGRWLNGMRATGAFIHIFSDGSFRVGECYMS